MEILGAFDRFATLVGDTFRKTLRESFTRVEIAHISRSRDGQPRRRGVRRSASSGRNYPTAHGHNHMRENARRQRQFRQDAMGFVVHSGHIVWGVPANANARAAA